MTSLKKIVRDTCTSWGADPQNVSVSVMREDGDVHWRAGVHHYPASVVKLFHLRCAFVAMEYRGVADTPELRRAMTNMISWSSNDADAYVIDRITATTNTGEDYEYAEEWKRMREWPNRYFGNHLKYGDLYIASKTYDDSAYGLEGKVLESNRLTSAQAARCMFDISTGDALESQEALRLLRRPVGGRSAPNDQASDFLAALFVQDQERPIRLYSKAGWGSTVRHDVAYIEQEGGKRTVIAAFTSNSTPKQVLWNLGKRIWDGLDDLT